jgi:8-hydroxy-5-deazaflavin:NADPH oxidoreductase
VKIAVIGAGNIGGTIGSRWADSGHDVVYGLRDPSKRPGAQLIGEALAGAEVVLLAIPGPAVAEFAREHSTGLDGKILIDASNNIRGARNNAWSELSAAVPAAQLFRAFNSLGWEIFANPVVGGVQADLFYCGPDGSKNVVEKLIVDAGLRPIWVGGADQADTVDGVLRLWIMLTRQRGRRIAFNLVSD